MKLETPRKDRGFALVTILVLVLVVVVIGMLTAGATRVETQIVNTIRNERIAFYAAEAGISEALMRLGLTSSTPIAYSGVGTFNPSFTGAFAPDAGQPDWCAQIVFTSAGTYPSKSGNTVTTPSIQASTSRMAYSNASLADATNLTLRWARPTPLGQGCTGTPSGSIRQIDGQNVLQIVSTGRSGNARRTVKLDVLLGGNVSTVVLDGAACPGVRSQGTGAINFPGSVVVDSTCSTAVAAGGNASISAAGSISVVGSGYSGDISPTPSTGITRVEDPLAALTPPALTGRPVRVYGSSLPATIQPGIYVGGLTIKNATVVMASGVYIMKGGGFHVLSGGRINMDGTNGVLIYNTCSTYPSCTSTSSYGTVELKNNQPIYMDALTTASPEADEWAGLVIWQERVSRRAIEVNAGADGDVNGLIYARDAALTMQGGSDLLHSQLIVGSIDLQGGPVIGEPRVWVDIPGASSTPVAKAWVDF